MRRSYKSDKKVEKAIEFLISSVNSSGHNPKPVILHSVRVGMRLYKGNYSEEVVLAGFLHDLLEDTDVTEREISAKFGSRVAKLVSANSFNKKTKGKEKRYEEIFQKCQTLGKEALAVKAVDILDNLPYYSWPNDSYARSMVNKFIEIASSSLDGDAPFNELVNSFQGLSREELKSIAFRPISVLRRGQLFIMLTKSYRELTEVYDKKNRTKYLRSWQDFDRSTFGNPETIGKYVFVTCLDGVPIGFASHDPRNFPRYGIIGQNCILPDYKGRRYGRMQIEEVLRIFREGRCKIAKVSTGDGDFFIPARKMYESLGFKRRGSLFEEKFGYQIVEYEKKLS